MDKISIIYRNMVEIIRNCRKIKKNRSKFQLIGLHNINKMVLQSKMENRRVENIILTFNEEIKENAGYGASEILAFDGNGTPITGKYNRFCYTSKEVFSGDKHVTFPVAEGIEIYSGDYTIKVSEGLVSDKELNANASLTKTIKILP